MRLEQYIEDEVKPLPEEQWSEIECPYCGENFEIGLDPSSEFQSFVNDCEICCKPIQVDAEWEDGELTVGTSRI
ncbi:MAG: CPXCG motif-containing cysteine-rich protein [Elusimicrobia bacterium]|nr:CPXCG motif-containing cysteine-rich protein [Elusimicrobiota bacterium]